MLNDVFWRQSGALIGGDGTVWLLSLHPLSLLFMFVAVMTTDGALAVVLDTLPQGVVDPTVVSPS